MKKYFTVSELSADSAKKYKLESLKEKCKFLHEHIYTNSYFYEANNSGFMIYNFFDMYFAVNSSDNNTKTLNTKIVFSDEKDISDEEISLELRGTKTLKIIDENCYQDDTAKIVFDAKNIMFINFINNDESNFERFLILYALYLAYKKQDKIF
ncbi:hypothetical protein [Campylobacter pinnipediorum]|uniref:hypothetical protein n=1 Tax=Campylobacter pinnipediorum TaxID=1965231 RepID=UPI00084DC3A5|nr:hypothetical protein [Campylobacter pinnipediorum]